MMFPASEQSEAGFCAFCALLVNCHKKVLTRYGVYDIMKLRGANATKQEHRWELSTAQVHTQPTTTIISTSKRICKVIS